MLTRILFKIEKFVEIFVTQYKLSSEKDVENTKESVFGIKILKAHFSHTSGFFQAKLFFFLSIMSDYVNYTDFISYFVSQERSSQYQ